MSTTPRKPWKYGYVTPKSVTPKRHARTRKSAVVRDQRREGVAIVVVMTVITMLTVLAAELLQSSSTAFQVATGERDRLRAEYLAKSGLNLTRLLIANEPAIRQVVAPIFQLTGLGQPPQLNVWDFADMLLAPFASKEATEGLGEETGIDFSLMEGLTDTHGSFDVITVPENAKINVNLPLFFSGDSAKASIGDQVYTLLGGKQSPNSPYDLMFSARDADGFYTTRLDVVSALIDWWDYDQNRTIYDPTSTPPISSGGSEDDAYSQLRDPYVVKNAPYDSIEELRMIRGVGDDFWATFVEGQLDDPRTRAITIYGSGAVNVNLAPPKVLLARLCSFLTDQPLCNDPAQQAAFEALLTTAKSIVPVAIFSKPETFINFVTGTPSGGLDMYTMLKGILGDSPLMAWTPVVISEQEKQQMAGKFLVAASIFTIQSTGTVGKARAKMTMVVNYDPPWKPPLGVTATRPPLGVVHYYRLE